MVKKFRVILTALVIVLLCGIGFLAYGKQENKNSNAEKENPTSAPVVQDFATPIAATSDQQTASQKPETSSDAMVEPTVKPAVEPTANQTVAPTVTPTIVPTAEPTTKPAAAPVAEATEKPTAAPTETPSEKPAESKNSKYVIVIDAGHQAKGDSSQEPIGPGAKETKKKVSSGTQGRFTGVPEYKVNLQVAQKLEKALTKLEYTVIMVRETNDVNISNSERAEVANDNDADMLIRIHCNGSEDPSVNGILTICPTKNNKYCKHIYADSRRLSDCLLEGLVDTTKANSRGVTETDSMSGINWSLVPVTIVEMGYMTNEDEDNKLVSEEYQNQLVEGMVKGIQTYLGEKE